MELPGGAHPVLLYDGVCGLCNRVVQFTLRHDRKDVFRFAPLQSELAGRALARHGESAKDLNSVYVVLGMGQAQERLLGRSDAVIYLFRTLGGRWKALAAVYEILPRSARDVLYNLVARNRYRVFGKFEACPVPQAGVRRKFLE
jgi:predicted DCC family thiol-disulfide oxidoreductase YuxK